MTLNPAESLLAVACLCCELISLVELLYILYRMKYRIADMRRRKKIFSLARARCIYHFHVVLLKLKL